MTSRSDSKDQADQTAPLASGLEAINLCVDLGSERVLQDLNLCVRQGEIMALLGPSGCGKTTFLRATAGLQRLKAGRLLWEGRDLAPIPPHRRRFGMVFQDHALLPHRSVGENVAFGLKMMGMPPEQRHRKTGEMLNLVDLSGYENRSVSTLLLDEPFAALDRPLQERLILDIRRILMGRAQTAIGVTHDHAEAFALADRVALMRNRKIHRVGTPQELNDDPRDVFTASFLNLGAVLAPEEIRFRADGSLETPWGSTGLRNDTFATELTPHLLIKPEAVRIASDGTPALITQVQLISGRNLATFETPGAPPIKGYVGDGVHTGTRCLIKLETTGILPLQS